MSKLFPLATTLGRSWRPIPVENDTMAPTAKRGDVWMSVPADRFLGDGLYVLLHNGRPCVWRCQSDFRGGIEAKLDNKAHGGSFTMTPAAFAEAVMGRVAYVCTRVS